MTDRETIKTLMESHGGRFAAELGIDLCSGRSDEVFKWLLASVLFGARISGTLVKKTFREFLSQRILSPQAILNTGWDGLVAVLDRGGYVRYDFKTASKLLEMCTALTEDYPAGLTDLHATAADPGDLEQRIRSLAKGIGDVTVNIFLRELRGIWGKADPLPSDLAVMAAKEWGIIPPSARNRKQILDLLKRIWKEAGLKNYDFADFESALVRAGIEARRKHRAAA